MDYKLIKKFPNSPELGFITKPKKGIVDKRDHYWAGDWFNPEEFPEFWEEVVKIPEYVRCIKSDMGLEICKVYKVLKKREWTVGEGWVYDLEINKKILQPYYTSYFTPATKEEYDAQFIVPKTYEIQKLKSKHGRVSNMFNKDKGVGWSSDDKPHYSIPEDLVSKGEHSIHSVKRLSDSEVFSIGDKIGADIFKNNVIEKFDIQNGNMYVITSSGTTPLHLIYHARNPLFTTEDNVEIFEGDDYFWLSDLSNYNMVHWNKASKEHSGLEPKHIYFSTNQAAEDYIVRNKVLFVTEDGVEIKENDYYCWVDDDFCIQHNSSASNGSGTAGYIYFSSEEKAQEYIDMNKPQYSFKDVENMFIKKGNSRGCYSKYLEILKGK